MVKLGEFYRKTSSINPARVPHEEFTLYSIPSFDEGVPEQVIGSQIKSSKTALQENDVLLSKIVPHIRRAWIVTHHDNQVLGSSEWIVFHPDEWLDPSFLKHFLVSDFFHAQLMNTVAGVGGSLNRARPAAVAHIMIPLPPLEEQKRIAKILDQVSKSIEEVNSQLSKFDELIQAHFHQQFSEELMITEPLGDVATLIGGKSIVDKHQETKTPYKVLKISAVTSGQFKPGESKNLPADYIPPSEHLVRPGDLLISRANTAELVGATALVPEDVDTNLALPDKIWRFHWKNKESSPVFYRTLLQLPETRAKISRLCSGTGGSMKNIPKAKLLQLEIPKVDPETQQDFEQIVQKIEHTKSLVNNKKLKLIELQKSLQTRAFQGLL